MIRVQNQRRLTEGLFQFVRSKTFGQIHDPVFQEFKSFFLGGGKAMCLALRAYGRTWIVSTRRVEFVLADPAHQVRQVRRVGIKQAFFGGVHEGFGTHFLSENLLKACLKTHAILIGM